MEWIRLDADRHLANLSCRYHSLRFGARVSGTDVYVGGRLYYPATFQNRGFVYKWNGLTWAELGSGMTNADSWLSGSVNSLALLGGEVYAGGYFTLAGGTPANRIAKWNGTNWSPLGTGMNGSVQALTIWARTFTPAANSRQRAGQPLLRSQAGPAPLGRISATAR